MSENLYHIRKNGYTLPYLYTYEELVSTGFIECERTEVKRPSDKHWTNVTDFYFPEDPQRNISLAVGTSSSAFRQFEIDECGHIIDKNGIMQVPPSPPTPQTTGDFTTANQASSSSDNSYQYKRETPEQRTRRRIKRALKVIGQTILVIVIVCVILIFIPFDNIAKKVAVIAGGLWCIWCFWTS